MSNETQTQGQDINMVELVNSLNATISSLRVELDTLKLNSSPQFKPADFQSKAFQEMVNTDSLSFISKKFNAGMNQFKQIADFMKLNKVSDLSPIFGVKSGKAITMINDYLAYMGQEKIKPVKVTRV